MLMTVLLQSLFLLASHASLFKAAHWFFGKHLYKDYEVKNHGVQYLFSFTFTVSVSMLQMLLFELMDVLDVGIRRFLWRVDLFAITALVYVFLPLALIYSVTSLYDSEISLRLTAALSVVCLPPLWFLFFKAGRLIHLEGFSLSTEQLLARMGVCGVAVVSALAGFGAVAFPYENIAFFLSPISQAQAEAVENRLLHTLSLIGKKKREWRELKPGGMGSLPGSLSNSASAHWPGSHSTSEAAAVPQVRHGAVAAAAAANGFGVSQHGDAGRRESLEGGRRRSWGGGQSPIAGWGDHASQAGGGHWGGGSSQQGVPLWNAKRGVAGGGGGGSPSSHQRGHSGGDVGGGGGGVRSSGFSWSSMLKKAWGGFGSGSAATTRRLRELEEEVR
eukprot:Cvel_25352.t2-p1 / transcript=Cvel_25352.t2 / gene=Cvel_25352 / organism=Chromera_velia_CCMP2878 / gene_product=Golgi pH regulator, putative / transcript_product=Golgi pH regulator, putative / location=Cvel_scaffold2860:4709-5871(+) / protein_length=387 / sequence_SO=supercontig / SO=protein_coding / is_pseudo=false